jgi:hypothetical protein
MLGVRMTRISNTRIAHFLLELAVAALMAACGSVPPATTPIQDVTPASLASAYAQLASQGGRVFALQPASSRIRIYVFRAGRAAKFGHNHVLSAPSFEGYFYLPDAGPAESTFDLGFRLDQLTIDAEADRAGLGVAFDSAVSQDAIDGTREHMLGPNNMQADRYPLVRIHCLQVAGEAPKFAAKLVVEMHGMRREMWVPLNVTGLPSQVNVSGSLVLKQTDFGITPYSVLGGLLAVQDAVVVEFNLVGAP